MLSPVKKTLFSILSILLIVLFSYGFQLANAQPMQYYEKPEQFFLFLNDSCNQIESTDFIVYSKPFSCSPAVVTSDLLEERPVVVFCKVAGLKINPLIEMPMIKSIRVRLINRSKVVSSAVFHPARLASTIDFTKEFELRGTPTITDLGYVTIYLQPMPEEEMPENVTVQLQAEIQYDVARLYGIDRNELWLAKLDDEEWQKNFNDYAIFNGRAFARLIDVTGSSATISIYDKNLMYPYTITLKEGERKKIPLAGFYCPTYYSIELSSIDIAKPTAYIYINGKLYSVVEGESFYVDDVYCRVESVNLGFMHNTGTVSLVCGGKKIELSVEQAKATIMVDDAKYEKSVGDSLLIDGKYFYVGYIAKVIENDKTDEFVLLFESKTGEAISEKDLKKVINMINDAFEQEVKKQGVLTLSLVQEVIKQNQVKQKLEKYGFSSNIWVIETNVVKSIGNSEVKLESTTALATGKISTDAYEAYEKAKQAYLDVAYQHPFTPYEDSYAGLIALQEAKELAKSFGNIQDEAMILQKIIETYSSDDATRNIAKLAEIELNRLTTLSYEKASNTVEIQSKPFVFSLAYILTPNLEKLNAKIEVNGQQGVYGLNDFISDSWYIANIQENSIVVKTKDVSNEKYGQNIVVSEETTARLYEMKDGEKQYFEVKLISTNVEKQAKIVVIPPEERRISKNNFTITIGIEKRTFQLNPEQASKTIEKLNKTIEKLNAINNKLYNTVKVWKKACYATGIALTIKNFISNLGGKALARNIALRGVTGNDGWLAICSDKVNKGLSRSIDECLFENADKVESDVNKIAEALQQAEEIMQQAENKCKNKGGEEKEKCFYEQIKPQNIFNNINLAELYNAYLISKDDVKKLLAAQFAKRSVSTDLQKKLEQAINAKLDYWKKASELLSQGKEIKNGRSESTVVRLTPGMEITAKVFQEENDVKYGRESFKGKWVVDIITEQESYYLVLDPLAQDRFRVKERYKIAERNEGGIPTKLEKVTDKDDPIMQVTTVRKLRCSNEFANTEQTKIRFHETGKYAGLPSYLPIIRGKFKGYYAYMPSVIDTRAGGGLSTYLENGMPNNIWICNIGENGIADFAFTGNINDDECIQVIANIPQIRTSMCDLSEAEFTSLYNTIKKCIAEAANQFGQKGEIKTTCGNFIRGKPLAEKPTLQCYDIMPITDCKILFNVCDPVVCPPSRCDFGGRYPVSDVIQTGIIGSLLLCLPNFEGGKGVLMPICLTGLHAGIDGLTKVLEATRDCMQERINSGKYIGICDQIFSFYLCQLLWQNIGPFVQSGLQTITSGLLDRGGGEYSNFIASFNTAFKSVEYLNQYYGITAKKVFKLGNTAEIATGFCKNFASIAFPTQASLIDQLAEPESPYQFTAWFTETPYTEVTVPAQSHYKVFYFIYAGKDQGVYYSVYLKNPAQTGYTYIPQILTIETGYLQKGQYLQRSKDIVAASGYSELCVNINGKESCGFGSVSTNFALEEIKNIYLENQLKADITKSSECVAGKPSFLPAIPNLNLQTAAVDAIKPVLYRRGIIRVCATKNPGVGAEEEKWVKVGYCDTPEVGCWLYVESVEQAISDLGIKQQLLNDIEKQRIAYMIDEQGYLTEEATKNVTEKIEKKVSDLISEINKEKCEEKQLKELKENVKKIVTEIEENESKIILESPLAEIRLLKARLWKALALKLKECERKAEEVKEKEIPERKIGLQTLIIRCRNQDGKFIRKEYCKEILYGTPTDIRFDVWPVEGKFYNVSSCYGCRKLSLHTGGADLGCSSEYPDFHDGIDIEANEGAKVYALIHGKVIRVIKNCNQNCQNRNECDIGCSYGNTVIIRSDDKRIVIRYSHLKDVYVDEGDKIYLDEYSRSGGLGVGLTKKVIGTVGNTGVSTGPHLHISVYYVDLSKSDDEVANLALRKDTANVDPLTLFSDYILENIIFDTNSNCLHTYNINSFDEIIDAIKSRRDFVCCKELTKEAQGKKWYACRVNDVYQCVPDRSMCDNGQFVHCESNTKEKCEECLRKLDKQQNGKLLGCDACGAGISNICDIEECHKLNNCFFFFNTINPCKDCSQAKSCIDFSNDKEQCENIICTLDAGLICKFESYLPSGVSCVGVKDPTITFMERVWFLFEINKEKELEYIVNNRKLIVTLVAKQQTENIQDEISKLILYINIIKSLHEIKQEKNIENIKDKLNKIESDLEKLKEKVGREPEEKLSLQIIISKIEGRIAKLKKKVNEGRKIKPEEASSLYKEYSEYINNHYKEFENLQVDCADFAITLLFNFVQEYNEKHMDKQLVLTLYDINGKQVKSNDLKEYKAKVDAKSIALYNTKVIEREEIIPGDLISFDRTKELNRGMEIWDTVVIVDKKLKSRVNNQEYYKYILMKGDIILREHVPLQVKVIEIDETNKDENYKKYFLGSPYVYQGKARRWDFEEIIKIVSLPTAKDFLDSTTKTQEKKQKPWQAILVSGNINRGYSTEGKTIDYTDDTTKICVILTDGQSYFNPKLKGTQILIGDKQISTKNIENNNIKIRWQIISPKWKHSIRNNCNPTYKCKLNKDSYVCSKNTYWINYQGENYEVVEYSAEDLGYQNYWCIKPTSKVGTYWYRAIIEIDGKTIYAGPKFASETNEENNKILVGKGYNKNNILTFSDYLKIPNKECEDKKTCAGVFVIDPRKAMRISRKSNYYDENKEKCEEIGKTRCKIIEMAESYRNVPYVEYHPNKCDLLDKSVSDEYLAAECGSFVNATYLRFGINRYTHIEGQANTLVSGDVAFNTKDGFIKVGDIIITKNSMYILFNDKGLPNHLDKNDIVLYSSFNTGTVRTAKIEQLAFYKNNEKIQIYIPSFQ